MMQTVEYYLNGLHDHRQDQILAFHQDHLELFDKAKGSGHNHQAWPGGYRHHLTQCFTLADIMWAHTWDLFRPMPFQLASAIIVLYFHDIEKMWKYTTGLPEGFDKIKYLHTDLVQKYNIVFTSEEDNALYYVHGEGMDYRSDQRVMNELAGFCHAVDTLSARVLWNKKEPKQ